MSCLNRALRTLSVFLVLFLGVFLLAAFFSGDLFAQKVTLNSLLDEMLDRTAVLKPGPEFTCQQFSSFDRKSKSPEENWFANGDTAQFLRVEERAGRKEWVLMDAEGPGAIVRWWITAPHWKNRVFIYLDGSETPAFSGNFRDLVGGNALCGAPLSQETARGMNLYLPIPYAKSIKITCDAMEEQKNLYYQINYRTYETGTEVESLTPEILKAASARTAQVNETLAAKPAVPPTNAFQKSTVNAGETVSLFVREGTGLLTGLSFQLVSESEGTGGLKESKDLTDEEKAAVKAQRNAEVLRSTILEIEFDGKTTVQVPLGDFFGTGVGVNPHHTFFTNVQEDGLLSAYWPMPFLKKADVRVRNLGKSPVTFLTSGMIEPLPEEVARRSTDEFLYFYADWHQDRNIQTLGGAGTMDWNYAALTGRGVFVGDVLSVRNFSAAWWGEGDEKIYVDGEKFPSHFGTGTEDYYGYAWCTPQFFQSPWRAQPRAEGPQNFGNVTNLRYRSLDRIPFEKDFRFDMEVWHWAKTKVDYAVTTFWYGTKNVRVDLSERKTSLEEEAVQPTAFRTPFQYQIASFQFAKAPHGNVSAQMMHSFKNGTWRNDSQLWWHGGKPGDELELKVKIPANARKMTLGLTRACDYGTFEFFLDGVRIAGPWDACNPTQGSEGVIHETQTFEIPQELVREKETERRLVIHLVGKSRRSTNTMFGMDFIDFQE